MKKYFLIIIIAVCVLAPLSSVFANPEELPIDERVTTTVVKAKIVGVQEKANDPIEGIDLATSVQTLTVEILKGDEEGNQVTFDNDYYHTFTVGDIIYLRISVAPNWDTHEYSVYEPYRGPLLIALLILFLACVFIFGGIQGVRGLATLVGSLVLIFAVLLPGILHGYSPILISLIIASLIVVVGSYITHGFNRTTSSAVLGMIGTLIITGIMATIAVHVGKLTGFASEEAMYLNLDTGGTINFSGLLLGGILIGLLGVLYDAAIGQAIAVEELYRVGPHVPRGYIFKRALRMGREHIGALVNTLAIAYVGASLPLMLLMYVSSNVSLGILMNSEVMSTEIIRTLIGSIGLVLAVPLTTALAVMMLISKKTSHHPSSITVSHEMHALEHVGHKH